MLAKKNKPKCRCAPGTPYRPISELEGLSPKERNIKSYPWDPDGPNPTRTGHQPGCPCDVAAYKPGELYMVCRRSWFRDAISKKAFALLEEGPLPDEYQDDRPVCSQIGGSENPLIGVYLKKEK